MPDRIDKINRTDYERVEASAETDKEKGQREQENAKDSFSSTKEKTDWEIFLDRSKLWNKNIQIHQHEVEKVLFKRMNLKTDPSLLMVDIVLKGEEVISPAFIALSRMKALQIKNLLLDEPIPKELLFVDDILRITIPKNPQLFKEMQQEAKEQKNKESSSAHSQPVFPNTEKKPEDFIEKLLYQVRLKDQKTKELRIDNMAIYGAAFLIFIIICTGIILILS